MLLEDTPPSSPALELASEGDDEEFVEVDEDELVEILEGQEGPSNDSDDDDDDDGEAYPADLDDPLLGPSPERDDAALVFTKHTGSVFCCAVEPTEGKLALTGGQDDIAYLWEISSGNVLLECQGHSDSVTQVGFNHDGSLFATGDMGGIIQVWRTTTHQKIWDYQLGDLMWLKWHRGANVLLAGSHSSEVYMWKIPSGDCKIFTAHGSPCENGVIMPDGKRAFVGYSDGKLKVLDLRQNTVIHTINAEGEEDSNPVPCIDAHTDNNLVLASVNGRPLLVSSQQGKILSLLDRQVQGEAKEEWIETIGFCPDKTVSLASYGTLNGYLFIWDLAHQAQRNVLKQEGAITSQIWEPVQPLVYTAGSDGIVRLFDLRAGAIQREWLGHRADVLEIIRSPNGSVLLSASDDKTARVFPLL